MSQIVASVEKKSTYDIFVLVWVASMSFSALLAEVRHTSGTCDPALREPRFCSTFLIIPGAT